MTTPPCRPADSFARLIHDFLVIAVVAFVTVGYLTGVDAIAGTARFAWNAIVLAGSTLLRIAGGFLTLVANGTYLGKAHGALTRRASVQRTNIASTFL